MTSIAQRRVAGATALMILLYLIQVALFSPAGMAAVVPSGSDPGPGSTCPQGGELGWSSHQTDAADDTVTGPFGEIEFTKSPEGLTATVSADHQVIICVKQGAGYELFTVTYEDDEQPQPVWDGDLSHWSYRYEVVTTTDVTIEIEKCSPGDVPIDVYFDIPDEGYNVKVYDSEGTTLKVVTEDLTWLAPAGTYTWEMFANGDSGTVIDSGEFEVPVCVVTIVVETCSDEGALVDVSIDIPDGYNVKVYDSEGTTVKAVTEDLTFFVGAGTYTWELFANGLPGKVFGSGEFEVEPCEGTTTTTEGTTTTTEGTTTTTEGSTTTTTQGSTTTTEGTTTTTAGITTFDSLPTTTTTEDVSVLGTTITTAPQEVSADTLPFTGFESGDTLKLGLLALLAGALMLFAVRGTREEEAQASADLGGWSTF